MMKKLLIVLTIIVSIVIVSCDRLEESQLVDEQAKLKAWLQVNNIDAELKPSGLYFIEIQPGTSETIPEVGDYVIYSYVEKTLEGDVFRSCIMDTAEFWGFYNAATHYVPSFILNKKVNTTNYPIGIIDGFSYMKEGGKARLILPSTLAYGKNGLSNVTNYVYIPGYTSIIVDIELVKVVKDPEVYEQGLIEDYINQYYPGLQPTADSIYFISLEEGTGSTVANDSTVYVKYTGSFLDDFVFDTNIDSVARARDIYNSSGSYDSLSFKVADNTTVIKGMNAAVKLMKEWGKAKVIIPSVNAYGYAGSEKIPPYTPLIFEIELRTVDNLDIKDK